MSDNLPANPDPDDGHGAEITPLPEGVAPSHFSSPDFPVADIPHRPRRTDTDPKAAKAAERQVSIMFMLSAVMVVLFCVAYFAIPDDAYWSLPPFLGSLKADNFALGVTFGLAILLIGIAVIQWAKKLMPDVEVVQERHPMSSEPADRAEAIRVFNAGAADSGFAQRKLVRRTLIGAMALFPIPLVILLRDLDKGPLDPEVLEHTIWGEPGEGEVDAEGQQLGQRIVLDPTYNPIKPEDIEVGGLVNAIPANLREVQEAEHNQNARAKAAIILVRMAPEEIRSQQGDGWDYQGILAFSKICTHMGCPISLYQQRTHHLLCPCHQSTFDLADSGRVVFGPAARDLPQLAITVDDEGYLVARGDFTQPVGPSYWERG